MSSHFREDVYLFTDCDLDGAGCYYVLRKYLGVDFNHTQTSEKKFNEYFASLENKEFYKRIYICDLSILESNLHLIDLPNVVYVNHRNTEKYKKINTISLRQESQDSTSCTMLLYKKLKNKFKTPFSKEEKILVSLIDDYDSYEHKFSNSLKLHYLYSAMGNDRLRKFFNRFELGFNGFDSTETIKIQNISDTIQHTFKNLKIFQGSLNISNQNISICSTFNTIYPSEICSLLIDNYKCDIALSVNLNTSSVSVRKNKNCNINLGAFAKKILNGGGDESVAGGTITKNFLELSKYLYPIT